MQPPRNVWHIQKLRLAVAFITSCFNLERICRAQATCESSENSKNPQTDYCICWGGLEVGLTCSEIQQSKTWGFRRNQCQPPCADVCSSFLKGLVAISTPDSDQIWEQSVRVHLHVRASLHVHDEQDRLQGGYLGGVCWPLQGRAITSHSHFSCKLLVAFCCIPCICKRCSEGTGGIR